MRKRLKKLRNTEIMSEEFETRDCIVKMNNHEARTK